MEKSIIILLSLFLALPLYAQEDTINQMDPSGNRTGYWKGLYPNGNLRYEGYFADNLPVGNFKRYYITGVIKATLTRHPDSLLVHAKLYDEDGLLRASGDYKDQKKTGIWQYFADKRKVALRATYTNDQLDGFATRYHSNGKPMDQTSWKGHQLHGIRTLYTINGKKQAEIEYIQNVQDGKYLVFNEGGFIVINGRYSKNSKEGKWQHFTEDGKLDYELFYESGVLMNPEILDDKRKKAFEVYEQNKGKLKDPRNYLDDPITYFKK